MKICAKCGKSEGGKESFAGSFCMQCFSGEKTLFEFPKSLELLVCHKCGKARLAGEWKLLVLRELEKWLSTKVKTYYDLKGFSLQPFSPNLFQGKNIPLDAIITLEINGKEIEKKTQVVLLLKKSSCSACLRKSSGYFEAIIQLRGNSLKVARARQDLQKAVKRFKSFINKTDEKKEGIDLFIESRQAAHEALGCLKLKYATSRKQSGMREGKKLYRTTYCVRL